jgi:co-chaperonin GroES (HSP10)
MTKYIPHSDYIICERVTPEKKSSGGLILISDENDLQHDLAWGKVKAVGPGKVIDTTGPIPIAIKPDTIIVFQPNIALKYNFGGDDFYLVRATFVIMEIEGMDVLPYNPDKVVDSAQYKNFGTRELG